MQLVLLDHLFPHRLERSQPHVQRDLRRLDAALPDALQDLVGEV